jgi:spoIIIJ-associated protein
MNQEDIDNSILFAKRYLEDLLSFFGLNTDIYATTEDNEVIELHVPSSHLNGFLIGSRGDTIRAIQYIVSTALRNGGHPVSRVNVDIADYKKSQAERLASRAQEWIEEVLKTKKAISLKPMNASERRIIHKIAGEAGLTTTSEGEGRDRHVVLSITESN